MAPLAPPNPDGNLEDRLRGLILNNASPLFATTNPHGPPLPPHMITASLEEQQEYLRKEQVLSPISPAVGQSPTGRRRPNQAQRRQLNAQTASVFHVNDGSGVPPINTFQTHRGPASFNSPTRQTYEYNHQQRLHSGQAPHPRHPSAPHAPLPQHGGNYPRSPLYPAGSNHSFSPRHPQSPGQLYEPGGYGGNGRSQFSGHQEIKEQSMYLDTLAQECVPVVGIDRQEEVEKDQFRAVLEEACRATILEYERQELGNENFKASSVELQCFGSMSSGYATKASDMDLALLTPESIPAPDSADSATPRLLEKKLLELGYGARLLSRTRVPIIKLCQKPTDKLRADLLAARAKWENGFILEADEEEEATEQVTDEAGGPLPARGTENQVVVTSSSLEVRATPSTGELPEMKQHHQQSLDDYYSLAKRLLRRLGGRDFSPVSSSFTDDEAQLLNKTCRAFIAGLSSEPLIEQLRRYQSVSVLFDDTIPFSRRSLHGVFAQVEGERLAMAWDNRPVTEASERMEAIGRALIDEWQTLQDKVQAYEDPLFFNKQIHIAVERLKRVSSLQLMFLEQLPYEEPVKYQSRAQKILDDLRCRDQPGSNDNNSLRSIVIAHYLAGISDTTTREHLQQIPELGLSLGQVALRHRMLKLARDYEQALEEELYAAENIPEIEQYIELLRTKSCGVAASLGTTVSETEAELVARVRTLSEPIILSSNKPRDRYHDPLEFPKNGVGIQCDINFSAHLALHNTLLLRCYSHCDPRVKILILFVKHWAKARGINTPYRGTLSSYGYVLMVLHYLVNVAQPFVCPNLQLVKKDPPPYLSPAEIAARSVCNGRDVRFWRNESEIKNLASRKLISHNHDSAGFLLRGFFEYFAQTGPMSTANCRGFDWGREVLSLRTPGGILSKQQKGWVGAKTVIETSTVAAPPTPTTPFLLSPKARTPTTPHRSIPIGTDSSEPKTPKPIFKTIEETKEIRHRYLFAIEDPFEHDHNVARTVTHNGIVSIRDEFRRAWRIIRSAGKQDQGKSEDLLDPVNVYSETRSGLKQLFDLIHGPEGSVEGPKNG